MKKTFKKIAALLLAGALAATAALPAFATDGDTPAATGKTITLQTPSKGHTYELYQVFTGSYALINDEDTLGDIAWGNGVTDAGKTAFGKAAAAADAITDSEVGARKFANDIDQYLTNGVRKKAETTDDLAWSGLAEGYYIIKDVTPTSEMPEGETADLVVVQVLDDVTIKAKSGTVEFDKKVADRNDTNMKPTVYDKWGNTSDYDVGDDVPYQVTIKLPQNFSSYTKYIMTVHDKMDAGLSFNNDVVVKIGETIVPASAYTVKTSDVPDGETFDIVFADVTGIAGAGDNVGFTITYSAKLTGANVVYGNPGNKNEAWLTYSNNPTTGQEGGTTPHKITVTFTYKLEVDKTDGTNPLPGAEFTLEKSVKGDDEKNTWTPLALIKNDAGTIFTFDGLDDGLYRITETKTPAGYNSIDPIYFVVEAEHSETLTSLVVKESDKDGIPLDTNEAKASFNVTLTKTNEKAAGLIDTQIINQQGSTLPSTGGMGTTIFYVIGGILILAAAIILISRRRVQQ